MKNILKLVMGAFVYVLVIAVAAASTVSPDERGQIVGLVLAMTAFLIVFVVVGQWLLKHLILLGFRLIFGKPQAPMTEGEEH